MVFLLVPFKVLVNVNAKKFNKLYTPGARCRLLRPILLSQGSWLYEKKHMDI